MTIWLDERTLTVQLFHQESIYQKTSLPFWNCIANCPIDKNSQLSILLRECLRVEFSIELEKQSMDSFRDNLRELMASRSLTQKSLAIKSGVPASSIASWLGKQASLPNIEAAYKIAKALDCSIEELLGFEDELDNNKRILLSNDEAHFVMLYRRLTERQKFAALIFLREYLHDNC